MATWGGGGGDDQSSQKPEVLPQTTEFSGQPFWGLEAFKGLRWGWGWDVMEGEKRVLPPTRNLAIHLLLRCSWQPTAQ